MTGTTRRRARALVAGLALLAGLAAFLPPMPATAAPPPANCKTADGKQAAKDGSDLAPGCFSLNVSPARIVIRPSATKRDMTQTFTVTDDGNTDYHLQVFAIEFTQDANGGLTQVKSPDEAASWVVIDRPSLMMKGAYDRGPGTPGAVASAPVKVTIKPRPDASPGDHQIAIIFRKPADPGTKNIRVAPQIGAQVLIQIPGKVTSGVALVDPRFKSKSRMLGFNRSGAADLTVGVKNTGNVHHDFYSADDLSATVSGFGAPKNTVLSFPQFTVLRDSTRDVRSTWNASKKFATSKPPLLCWCKATIVANVTFPVHLTSTASSPSVTWKPLPDATGYTVYRDGAPLSSLPASATKWTDPQPDTKGGGVVYTVVGIVATASTTVDYHVVPVPLVLALAVGLLLLVGLLIWALRRRRGRAERQQQREDALAARLRAEIEAERNVSSQSDRRAE